MFSFTEAQICCTVVMRLELAQFIQFQHWFYRTFLPVCWVSMCSRPTQILFLNERRDLYSPCLIECLLKGLDFGLTFYPIDVVSLHSLSDTQFNHFERHDFPSKMFLLIFIHKTHAIRKLPNYVRLLT